MKRRVRMGLHWVVLLGATLENLCIQRVLTLNFSGG
ncbi:hypothetical protein APTSU1_000654400 [Apodemus speciosus]|uniref:Uncharacterized protein n=1 Tax=Apodemus speciosus TaxID=105296 RepID=A0ABQ0EW91_APOSI